MGPEGGPVGVGEIGAAIASVEAPSIEVSLSTMDSAFPQGEILSSSDILQNTVPYTDFWAEGISSDVQVHGESFHEMPIMWKAPQVGPESILPKSQELILPPLSNNEIVAKAAPLDVLGTTDDAIRSFSELESSTGEQPTIADTRSELHSYIYAETQASPDLQEEVATIEEQLPEEQTIKIVPKSTVDTIIDGVFGDGSKTDPAIQWAIVDAPEEMITADLEEEPLDETSIEVGSADAVNEKSDVKEATSLEESEDSTKVQVEMESETKVAEQEANQRQAGEKKEEFVVDKDANDERREMTQKAIEELLAEANKDTKMHITGKEVARLLPEAAPHEAKSKIVAMNKEDGSYEEYRNQMSEVEEFGTDPNKIIDDIIDKNNAVGIKGSIKATQSEIEKVLRDKGAETQIYEVAIGEHKEIKLAA